MIGGMFATTRWTLVAAAQGAGTPEAQAALADLCRLYWYPLYAYVRRRGHDHHQAQDLTQAFFARLLEKNDLTAADQTRGRFRSFLLTACQHFLLNQLDHDTARKRGGGKAHVPLDFAGADGRYAAEPAHDDTPERLFDRRWALELLDQALAELRQEYAAAGEAKQRLFEALSPVVGGEAEASYTQVGEKLGMSEGAVKVAAHRLRKRCRELLREAVAQTVADPAEVDEELRHLLAAVAG